MAKSSPRKVSLLRSSDGRQKPRPGPEEQARSIVDASVSLFLEKGVRSVSIMQICDRADVSRSTFYRCFDDIDGLLRHIYGVSVFEPVESFMLAKLNDPNTSPRQLKQALEDMYEAIFAQGEYAELLFRESNDPNSPAFQIVNDAFDRIVGLLQKGLPESVGKKTDAIYLKALLNANQWIAHDTIRKGLSAESKKAAKEAAWLLVIKLFELN